MNRTPELRRRGNIATQPRNNSLVGIAHHIDAGVLTMRKITL